MASPQLQNYLIRNRKRLALSQADVAFLIGARSGEKVSRHERFLRVPNLETALAYEAIYKRSVSELFPGLYQKVEQEVAARAKTRPEKTASIKRKTLKDIAGEQFTKFQN